MKSALLFACAFLLLIATNLTAINFDQRVDAQRAIERVYYSHRIWPAENPGPKPRLESALPEAFLRAKVEDYLRKSDVLERYWQRPITAQQLQAEMDRMARETKQPSVLRELFAALDNDPQLIAECLARPILVDRLIHNMYAGDERFHGALKRQIESELKITNTVEAMRALSGSYGESVWKKQDQSDKSAPTYTRDNAISLDAQEWKEWNERLQRQLGGLPLMRISRLQEDADRYYVIAILHKDEANVRLATVEWKKQAFDEWWMDARRQTQVKMAVPAFAYSLPVSSADTPSGADTWSPTAIGPPSGRVDHTAVWTGSEMIVWGGWNWVTSFNTGGRYNPATDSWAAGGITATGAPTARFRHTAVWTGSEMIVWGGSDADGLTNTGGRYNPSTDSWSTGGTTTTGAPTVREWHTAVWTGIEMIVWGGNLGPDYFDTGGRYNPSTNTWAAGGTSTMNAPIGREWHSAVWTGTEMIVWGGFRYEPLYGSHYENTGGRYNPSTNTWAIGGTSTTSAPTGRLQHSAIWTGTEMIIWGGMYGPLLNTGGRYNPATDTWAAGGTSTTNAPAARAQNRAVWTGTEMVIWGGYDGGAYLNSGGLYNPLTDTWTAGGTDTDGAPIGRASHAAVWTGAEMIVWGGIDGAACLNTGGRYNPTTDTWAAGGTGTNSAPIGRYWHTAVWTGAEMIVWGGYDGSATGVAFNTGGRYDPATDTWTAGGTSTTNAPTARRHHSTIWTGSEMIIWGGWDGALTNTGGRYNPATDTWATGATSEIDAPSTRAGQTAVWTGTQMIIWGGYDAVTSYLNTGGGYNPATDTWAAGGISTANAPLARTNHTAVWTGSEMIVWGGEDGLVYFNTGGRYNPAIDTWATFGTSAINAPTARSLHTAVWTGAEMIVWGGWNGLTYFNTGGRYNPGTGNWAAGSTSVADAPTGRASHTAVWTGKEMIIWGGYDGTNTNTGGWYDPSANTWAPGGTSLAGAPTGRFAHKAVWTGAEMIIWGGTDGSNYMNTGGVYSPVSCLFCDDFEDDVLDTDWTYIKPLWNETGGSLVATSSKKAIAVATPCFSGCRVCSVEAEMKTAGGIGNILWLLGWYVDKNNTMELLLKEDKNKIILKQRIAHTVVKKQAVKMTLNPNISYDIKIAFNGSQFDVYVDSVKIMSFVPAGAVPTGTVGFQVKRTVGAVDSINVQ